MRKAIFAVILCLTLITGESFASMKEDVKKGNLLYNSKKYSEAARAYEEALTKGEGSAMVNFNIGAARYKDEKYNMAVESFNRAIAAGSDNIIQFADFNIGNIQYRKGSAQEKRDIKKAKEMYETALSFYKRAIELDPGDRDAKFNYEFVSKKLENLNESVQNNQEQKQDKEKKEENKQDKKEEKDQNKDQDKKEGQKSDGGQGAGQDQDKAPGGQQEKKEGPQEQKDQKKEQDKNSSEESSGSEKGGDQDGRDKENKDEEGSAGSGDQEERQEDEGEGQGGPKEAEDRQPEQEGQGQEVKGLEFYQASDEQNGQSGEMSEQEAKMLLEGYKGEEATGKVIKMRNRPIELSEPIKDW